MDASQSAITVRRITRIVSHDEKGELMNFKMIRTAAAAALMLVAGAAMADDVTGAGASFPAPLYAKWAAAYSTATGVRINYQSVGSGAGIKQIKAKTVDFGASDMPLKDEELAKEGLVQFPTVIGGVVPVVNVKGIGPGQLKMTGEVLGNIYLGKITKWNDAAIVALNPGLALPDTTIAPVRRADASGTSFIFTNYLSKVNTEWAKNVGFDTSVKWPTGAGGKGNEGVSAFVQRLPNSIGYVEYAYAKQNKMSHVTLKNAAGNFVEPDDTTFKAAAAAAEWQKSFYQVLTNQGDKNAWPLSGATFILMHKSQDKPTQGAATLKFFDWAYNTGDKTAADLEYVALPASVKDLVRKQWASIGDASGKAVSYK